MKKTIELNFDFTGEFDDEDHLSHYREAALKAELTRLVIKLKRDLGYTDKELLNSLLDCSKDRI